MARTFDRVFHPNENGSLLDEQRAAVAYEGGNAYVGAGPGTGKTFLLVERYRFLRDRGVPGSKILVLTFSRRAVGELRERILAAGFPAAEVEVRTFHGFAARLLGGGTAIFRTGRLLDGFSRALLLERVVAKTPTPTLAASARTSRAFAREAGSLLEALALLSDAATDALRSEGSFRLADLLALSRALAATRASIGASDLGELVSRAVAEAKTPESRAAGWLDDRYAHVLIDELQDTDRTQLALLACIGARLFAVGDEAQSIYRFRGASNDIVADAIERFAMKRFNLTLSRRCTPEVCALAAQTPLPGLRPLHSARPSGDPVHVVRLHAVDDEVAFLADAIEALVDARVEPSEIAVLLRAFRPVGHLLVDELRRRAIPVAATGREELLGDARVATLRAALELLGDRRNPAKWYGLLASRSLGFDPIRVRLSAEALEHLEFGQALAVSLDPLTGEGILPGSALAGALTDAASAWDAGNLGVAARRLVRRLGLLAGLVKREPLEGVRAAASRLELVCDSLAGAQRTAAALGAPAACGDIVARFDDFVTAIGLDDAGFDPGVRGVRVLTVHAAKGLEFAHVFVADAVEGRFPQETRASSLLAPDDRELLARHGIDIGGVTVAAGPAMLEEASLWYVALTRSSSKLTLTFADRGLSGDVQRPSRFIPSMLVPPDATAVDRESLYVRALRLGESAQRDEALASGVLDDAPVLADYARLGDAAFDPAGGYVLREQIRLGVGDAESWLQCPRRLFYKKFARLAQEEGAGLTLGSVLHAVLQAFHETETAFDPDTVDVPRWQQQLEALRARLWDPARFETPIVASAAADAAAVALRSYATALGERAREGAFSVEDCERALAVPAGAFALSGRVDRIDRRPDGALVVLDYKLGHAKKDSVAKVTRKLVQMWHKSDADREPREPLARRASKDLRLQLALYASALENVASVAYVYLGGAAEPAERNGAVFEETPFAGDLHELATTALAEIGSGLLQPLATGSLRAFPVTFIEEHCTFCAYRGICPGAAEDVL